jgi:hypothetical protein
VGGKYSVSPAGCARLLRRRRLASFKVCTTSSTVQRKRYADAALVHLSCIPIQLYCVFLVYFDYSDTVYTVEYSTHRRVIFIM